MYRSINISVAVPLSGFPHRIVLPLHEQLLSQCRRVDTDAQHALFWKKLNKIVTVLSQDRGKE